jgi:FkbM family methyltransferase
MKQLRRRIHIALHDLLSKDPESFSPHGIKIHLPRNADPSIRYLLIRGRPYEQAESELIRKHLSKGMHVLELGGCMGIVSATIRATIGPKSRHVVVEALPELGRICEVNARIGAEPGAMTLVRAAVDYSGSASVRFAPRHNAHVGGIARDGESGIEVPTTTLSKLGELIPPGQFALVCDIEGTELEMIERDSAALDRIDVLILETHPKRYAQADLDGMHRRLHEQGLILVDSCVDVQCFTRRR